ncbi:MAG TPA: sensor domain-containing diguanylate cyclase [Candidimonas sp.]|nr:sensor domain-containing diguanylate cyclase [Candidimonas sp.]
MTPTDRGMPAARQASMEEAPLNAVIRRLQLQYDVASTLLWDRTANDGLMQVVEIIARNQGWDVGIAWLADGEQLRYQCMWGDPAVNVGPLLAQSLSISFKSSTGLLRSVLDTDTAAWSDTVAADSACPRIRAASAAGLTNAMAFPLRCGEALYGVIELSRRGAAAPDGEAVAAFSALSTDIGQFLEARRFESWLWAKHAGMPPAERIARPVNWDYSEPLALHDDLTGLANRTLLMERGNRALLRAERHGNTIAVLFADLDFFRAVNELHGHMVGDALLKLVAERLGACVRASDTVTRLSNDEFIILLPEITDADDVAIVAKKIISELSRPFLIDALELFVDVSMGISRFPHDGLDMPTLLQRADECLQDVKRDGGNGYRVCSEG